MTSVRKEQYERVSAKLWQGAVPSLAMQIAQEEAATLSPFLCSLSRRHPEYAPGDLSTMFVRHAETSGILLDQKFQILSTSDFHGLASHQECGKFKISEKIRGKDFSLGFLQKIDASRSHTVPLILIDKDILNDIETHAPRQLIGAMERIYTATNHDYLHHFTSEILNLDIATRFNVDRSEMLDISKGYFKGRFEGQYSDESFFLMSHAQSFQDACAHDPDFETAFHTDIGLAVSEISRISNEMQGENPSFSQQRRASDVVNYFGDAVLFSAIRVYPYDSAVLRDIAQSVQAIDPLPGYIPGSTPRPGMAESFVGAVRHAAGLPNHLSGKYARVDDAEADIKERILRVVRLAPEIPRLIIDIRDHPDKDYVQRIPTIETQIFRCVNTDVERRQKQAPAL